MNNLIFEDYFYYPKNVTKIENLSQLFRNLALYSWLKKVEDAELETSLDIDSSLILREIESQFKKGKLYNELSPEEAKDLILDFLDSNKSLELSFVKNAEIISSLRSLTTRPHLSKESYLFYLEVLEIYLNITENTIDDTYKFLTDQKELILKLSDKISGQYEGDNSEIKTNQISSLIEILSKFCSKHYSLFKNEDIKNQFLKIFISPNQYVKFMHHLTQISLNLLGIPQDDDNNDNLLAWNIREDLRIIVECIEQEGYYDTPQLVSYRGAKNEQFNFISKKSIKESYKKDILNYLSKVNFV